MSDITDTKKTSALSSFLDVHGIKTSPFAKNTSGERAYGRAERIVAALFLLTNHFSHLEQIRASLREKGVALLTAILSLRAGLRSSGADLVESAQALIRELISLMRMSAIAGYISLQNAGEVIQALDDLGSLLVVSQRSGLSETILLTHEDLVPSPGDGSASIKQKTQKGQTTPPAAIKDVTGQKTYVGFQTDTKSTKKQTLYRTSSTKARSQEVLEILRLNGRLGIKDIYSNMPGSSEKMVQRELAHLVSKGQVKKFGEKRWSTYEIVQ